MVVKGFHFRGTWLSWVTPQSEHGCHEIQHQWDLGCQALPYTEITESILSDHMTDHMTDYMTALPYTQISEAILSDHLALHSHWSLFFQCWPST